MKNNIFQQILQGFKSFYGVFKLDKLLKTLPKVFSDKKPAKNIWQMSTREFYEHLTNTKDIDSGSQKFFNFFLEYILLNYLDGKLDEEDVYKLTTIDNPYELNRYIEKSFQSAKMQGTLLDDLMKYQDAGEDVAELYSLILPEYAYDKEKKSLKIKTLDDLKQTIKDSVETMAEQKKQLALAKMQQAERERIEKIRQEMLAKSPEIAELISGDHYQTNQKEEVYNSDVLIKELEQMKKKTVIRKAVPSPEHKIKSKSEAEMSPSELIAYKKMILKKLHQDLNKDKGLNIKT